MHKAQPKTSLCNNWNMQNTLIQSLLIFWKYFKQRFSCDCWHLGPYIGIIAGQGCSLSLLCLYCRMSSIRQAYSHASAKALLFLWPMHFYPSARNSDGTDVEQLLYQLMVEMCHRDSMYLYTAVSGTDAVFGKAFFSLCRHFSRYPLRPTRLVTASSCIMLFSISADDN